MGLLRAATHEDWGIAVFVTPAQYDFFVHRVLADSVKNNYYLDFYRFRLDDPIPLSCKHDPLLEKANQFLARVPKVKRSPTLSQQTPFLPYDYCDVPSLYDWPYGETRMPDDDQDLKGRVYLPDPTTNPTQVTQNEIGESRHFLVIVEQDRGDSLPADTFVSYAYGDKMYYIKNEDYVSKKNFSLIGLLLTMEAVPQGSGLTPTIAVGGIGH